MSLVRKSAAECVGTFWLVFGGCGSAVLASRFLDPANAGINLGIGLVGVSLAFGLTVLTMAYAIGHISGCHLNPAVSTGLLVAGRFHVKDWRPYVAAQLLGGDRGLDGPVRDRQRQGGFQSGRRLCGQRLRPAFARRLFPDGRPHRRGRADVLLPAHHPRRDRRAGRRASRRSPSAWPDADPPDRHPGHEPLGEPGAEHRPGMFVGGWALAQLWLFWLAPLGGAVAAGAVYRVLAEEMPRSKAAAPPSGLAPAAH